MLGSGEAKQGAASQSAVCYQKKFCDQLVMLGFPAFLSHDIIVTNQVLVLVQFTNVHTAVENAVYK